MKTSLKGHLDVVKALIEAGANVNYTNKVSKYMHCCCTCTCIHFHIVSQACVHVCHNDAMGQMQALQSCTCTFKPWLHGMTCKGDRAIGRMLCGTLMNKLHSLEIVPIFIVVAQ